ncbi:hypothetical protein SUGI_0695470 [Cryptomeria japonica]|nr:hypothetical protein SUGI_0695470 [Cryptomeria japonica]
MLQETKFNLQQVESFGEGLRNQYNGCKQVAVQVEGASEGLLIIWKPSMVQIERVTSDKNWQMVTVEILSSNFSFLLINVYGHMSTALKHAFSSNLDGVISQNQNENLFIGGDSNAIRCLKDKRGGLIRLGKSQQEFNEWVERKGLLEVESRDIIYIWNNRRLGFSNISSFPFSLECKVLLCSGSDHYPLLLNFQGASNLSKPPFR